MYILCHTGYSLDNSVKWRYGMLRFLLLWIGGGLWCLSSLVLRPKRLSSDRLYQLEAKTGKFNELQYKNIKKYKFNIMSDYGYNLSCELLEPPCLSNSKKVKKIAVLCHGFSQGKYRSLIYAEIFLGMGFDVLIYDHRNHGLSGRAYTSMGYYEKYDLKKLVDWCYSTYGSDCKLVTHGESMGAATALLHLGIDERVTCSIADCAYSDLYDLLRHQAKHYYHLPHFFIPLESLITYIRAGFWYGDVSPIKVISKVDTPVLFIHGKKDDYVPTVMSKQMYRCKKGKKALYLVAGAEHAKSCLVNRLGYEEKLQSFIDKYIS
jgi:fermentation-respiration switch protein FrsA (DUF1100 family)